MNRRCEQSRDEYGTVACFCTWIAGKKIIAEQLGGRGDSDFITACCVSSSVKPFSALLLSWQMKHGAFFHVHQNKASISVPTGEVRRKNKHPNKLPKFNMECQMMVSKRNLLFQGAIFNHFQVPC